MRGQKTFDFGAKFVLAGARVIQECRALPGSAVEREVKHLLDPPPSIGVHDAAGPSSAYSHAFASVHSRLTVAGEMPSTSAASSIVNPPKNRSSTTRLCCGSTTASLVRA